MVTSETGSSIEEVLGAFSAIASDGLILLLGDTPLYYQKAVLSCMSALGRLVINLPEKSALEYTEDLSKTDLRVAVHCQDASEFLNDIKHHQLSMVVVQGQDANETLLGQVASMLPDGGVVLVIPSPKGRIPKLSNQSQTFCHASLGSCELFVKTTQPNKSRRGGRKARVSPN